MGIKDKFDQELELKYWEIWKCERCAYVLGVRQCAARQLKL